MSIIQKMQTSHINN